MSLTDFNQLCQMAWIHNHKKKHVPLWVTAVLSYRFKAYNNKHVFPNKLLQNKKCLWIVLVNFQDSAVRLCSDISQQGNESLASSELITEIASSSSLLEIWLWLGSVIEYRITFSDILSRIPKFNIQALANRCHLISVFYCMCCASQSSWINLEDFCN